jgi:hypothetical protein
MSGGWLLTGIFMIVQIAGKKRGCALDRHILTCQAVC